MSRQTPELSPADKRALLAQLLREKAGQPQRPFPLSYGQRALWFLYQLAPESAAYNVCVTVRIHADLDVRALRRSLQTLVDRHPSLRTVFGAEDGEPWQKVQDRAELDLEHVDVSTWTWTRLHDRLQEEMHRPFDLERGPLLRVFLFAQAAQEHILLLTVHHIIGDLWSLVVLLDELRVLYPAERAGKPAMLPPVKAHYADFVRWQSTALAGAEGERLEGYWRKQLAGELPVLGLPTDRPRPLLQTYRGAAHTFQLGKDVTRQVKDLARAEGVTPFHPLLAAYQTLLYRYTGQEDILVGSPVAGRSRPAFEKLVGYFVNMVVLRADLSGNPTFKHLLGQVRRTVWDSLEHQDYPFGLLVERLQPARDPSRSPVFQAAFILEKSQRIEQKGTPLFMMTQTQAQMKLGGLEMESIGVEQQVAQFDLTLAMEEVGDTLFGSLQYNTDLFDPATVARMAGHFQTLLEGMIAQPERGLADLPLLTAPERSQLLDWNATTADFPHDRCLHQLIQDQAWRTPDAVALSFEDEHLTYRELDRRANQLAKHLGTLGVGPEGLVGLCMERSPELVVGLLAVLKAGAAYVPLDPEYPPDRLAYMLQDARVPVLLTQQRLRDRLPGQDARLLCLDTVGDWLACDGQECPASGVTPQNLAYVIYTSGSTGWPKGAMNTHQAIVNRLLWMQRAYALSPADRVLQKTPFSFDVSVWEFFWPLLTGARLVLARPGGHRDPDYLVRLIRAQQVTVLHFVPSMLQAFLEAAGVEACTSLRRVFCSGEALPWELQERFFARLGADLHNLYGPTEAAVDVTYWDCPRGDPRQLVPIGRPIANTQLYVLDWRGQPVPVGVSGELHLGGVGLARGYLGRPDLTAQKFVPDPFGGEPGGRLYRTGDLVRWLPDGVVEFLGRLDHQVKLHGFRIELGEIETVLGQHPSVHQVVVVVRDGSPGGKQLAAYVVSRQGLAADTRELRRYLQGRLPAYMVPAHWVALDALPLSPNGKLDRRALPAPERGRAALAGNYLAPRTEAEETLAAIWAEVLGVGRVGVTDNFFELGGDSILSLQIIARANRAGLRLTPRQLFQHQTVAELAQVAGLARAAVAEQGVVTGPVPLTPIQRWFFEEGLPEPQHYNQALLLEVRQPLDPVVLRDVVRHLLEHHDALRLRFSPPTCPAGTWQQVNAGVGGEVPFQHVDLSALPEAEQSQAVERAAAETQASLDLAAGPLLQVVQFDLGPQTPGRLLVVIHHLAVDAVSWRILLEDLLIGYAQRSRGAAVQLPPKTTSFKQWAERLAEYARSEVVQQELAYWLAEPRQRAAGLPVDSPGGANTEASARTVEVVLGRAESQALLQDVPEAYRTQINDVLLTALAQSLAGWSGQRWLLVDLEGHGREDLFEDVDLSRTVGWFTTLFPVLLDSDPLTDPGSALKAVKEELRRVPGRGLCYGVLRYLGANPSGAEQLRSLPQAEVCFNYLGQLDGVLPGAAPLALAPESSGPARGLLRRRRHLLEVTGRVQQGRLRLSWSYSSNVHRPETVEGLARQFVERLQTLIKHCQSPDAGGHTPSDFPDAGLGQEDLDLLLGKISQSGGGQSS